MKASSLMWVVGGQILQYFFTLAISAKNAKAWQRQPGSGMFENHPRIGRQIPFLMGGAL